MADYITYDKFRTRHNITGTVDDATIHEVISEASRMIDGLCGRRFDGDTNATARVIYPLNSRCVWLPWDAHEVTAVKTDTSDNGTFDTTWDAADYQLSPLNGIGPNMQSGWPYTRIEAVSSRIFPTSARRPPVEVTAKWGWAATPDDIVGATFMLAFRLYEERKAAFGVVGNADFGALPIRDQRTVNRMLAPYMRREPVVA